MSTTSHTDTRPPALPRTYESTVPLWRLYVLRGGYLFMAIGLTLTRWPLLFHQDASRPVMDGVVVSMLVALSLLFFLGVRYPLRMLPILLFEMTWKVIWLGAVALPLWLAGELDDATLSVFLSCSLVVIVIAIVPWPYVVRHYIIERGDRWLPLPHRAPHLLPHTELDPNHRTQGEEE
jgi:hypothetical protein